MGGKLRNLWPVLLAAVIAVAAALWLYVVWQSRQRNDLSTYGAFAVAVVALAAGWIAWVWRQRRKQHDGQPGLPKLDELADQLAKAVTKQWQGAAGERGLLQPIPVRWQAPSEAMAGPAAAAVDSTGFPPLPGLRSVRVKGLQDGDIRDLHSLYGGLGSGRLVIAGAPGAGKSGAAVLLVLAALRHREQVADTERPRVPVPVLFTAQDWDPVSQRVQDWLALRIKETYPFLAGKVGRPNATALMDAGKVSLILDGLDEIPEELRPVALQALNQLAGLRIVVLSRTTEMVSAASQRGVLENAAAVELKAIDSAMAAKYLRGVQLDPPPEGWRNLIDRIRSAPSSPLAQALASPLTLTVVRDTYREGDNVHELLNFCERASPTASSARPPEEIVDHLLDRVLPTAYMRRPGDKAPRYDLHTAQAAFIQIADRMNESHTRDLEAQRLYLWAPIGPRSIVGGLATGLPVGIIAGVLVGCMAGRTAGIVTGLMLWIAIGGIFAISFWAINQRARRNRQPSGKGSVQRVAFKLGELRAGLPSASSTAAIIGLLAWLAAWIVLGSRFGLVAGLLRALLVGLAIATLYWVISFLAFALGYWFQTRVSINALSPLASWRSGRRLVLMLQMTSALAVGIGAGLIIGVKFGLVRGFATGILVGLMYALLSRLVTAAVSLLDVAQLARRLHTPLRLMKFLEDARYRNVLRTVGPVYQFRHARLQDRLAEQAKAPALAQDPSKVTAV